MPKHEKSLGVLRKPLLDNNISKKKGRNLEEKALITRIYKRSLSVLLLYFLLVICQVSGLGSIIKWAAHCRSSRHSKYLGLQSQIRTELVFEARVEDEYCLVCMACIVIVNSLTVL